MACTTTAHQLSQTNVKHYQRIPCTHIASVAVVWFKNYTPHKLTFWIPFVFSTNFLITICLFLALFILRLYGVKIDIRKLCGPTRNV